MNNNNSSSSGRASNSRLHSFILRCCCCSCRVNKKLSRVEITSGEMSNGEEELAKRRVDKAKLLWEPPLDVRDHQIDILRRQVNAENGVHLRDYGQLHEWSVENYDLFWELLWRFFGIRCSAEPSRPVVDKNVPMDKIPLWFPGARLNYAENLLRHPDDAKTAFFYTSERVSEVGVRSKTFGQLRRRVAFLAAALRAHGVGPGDRVAGYLPNFPESIELMAAAASIGAVWSSTSPDFGVSGVLERFRQIRPKLIFSVEAVSYNAKKHDNLAKLRAVVAGLEGLEKVVIIPYCHDEEDISLTGFGAASVCFLSAFVGREDGDAPALHFEQVPFHHPLFIMYSSGTTGAPKCMVHSVGGTLMKHLEEHRIQGNRSERDVLLYYTTVGWMMWNWMVTALALGTTLVLYDGSPLLPHDAALWDLVDKCGITVFGTSAKWIAVQEDRGVRPRETHRLTSLRAICSTGSPLMPHSYDYVYRDIKKDVLLASVSGGTDIIACFMGENSVLPVHRGEIQSAHLGCAVECWDDDGGRLEGVSGELVCVKPFPSMPVEFWNDPDGALYQAAYFNKYPGIWAHGDFLMVDKETKGLVMLGRSDGTLNPNGVRFGSAEIYSIIETFDEVEDSLCVGQRSPESNEERVILFLKMGPKQPMTSELVLRIKAKIRSDLSARHVPALVLPIADIPYTVNGKKVEVAVKNILVDKEVKNATALVNPDSLELYKNIPETKIW